jgi:hypothetical protein
MPDRLVDIGHFVVIADSVSIHKCPVLPCMHWFGTVSIVIRTAASKRVLIELWTLQFFGAGQNCTILSMDLPVFRSPQFA